MMSLDSLRPYLRSSILDDRVRVRELLHASGLVGELPVDEPARLVENVIPAGVLEEPLDVLAVPVELDVHVLSISTADRFHHFLYRGTAIDWKAILASFLTQDHLHLPICHSLVRRLLQWHCPATRNLQTFLSCSIDFVVFDRASPFWTIKCIFVLLLYLPENASETHAAVRAEPSFGLILIVVETRRIMLTGNLIRELHVEIIKSRFSLRHIEPRWI